MDKDDLLKSILEKLRGMANKASQRGVSNVRQQTDKITPVTQRVAQTVVKSNPRIQQTLNRPITLTTNQKGTSTTGVSEQANRDTQRARQRFTEEMSNLDTLVRSEDFSSAGQAEAVPFLHQAVAGIPRLRVLQEAPINIGLDPSDNNPLSLRNPNANKLARGVVEFVGNTAKALILGDPDTGKALELQQRFLAGESLSPEESALLKDFGERQSFNIAAGADGDVRDIGKFPAKNIKKNMNTPKDLEPLAQEARKYKSAKDFVKSQTKNFPDINKKQLTDIWNQATKGVGDELPRGYGETIKKAEVSDQLKGTISSTYEPKTNKFVLEKAQETIQYAPNDARRAVMDGPVSAENTALANELIKFHDLKGEFDIASELYDSYARKLTDAGQGIQAVAMFNKFSPDGVMNYARKITNNNLPDEVAEQLLEMSNSIKKLPTDSVEYQMGVHNMSELIARYAPQSGLDQAISVWKAGLLTSPTTTAGNLVGNTGMGVAAQTTNAIATVIDSFTSIFTGKRSVAITPRGILQGMKEGGTKGVEYFKTGFDPRRDPLSKFDVKKVYFGESRLGKAAEGYVDGVFRLMGAQDQPFYYAAFRNSLAQQAKVEAINQGLKGADALAFRRAFESAPPSKALELANAEARWVVFQDNTALGELGGRLANSSNPIVRGFMEFIAPFRGVPSSIAEKVVDFSPFGYLKPIKRIIDGVKSGTFDQRAFSQQLARPILGTFGLMSLGAALYDKGLMTLEYPKDQNERKLWEVEGKQPFSVYMGGSWRSLNYIQPALTMMAMGGEIKRARKDDGEDLDTAFFRGVMMLGKSVTEQSFLQGVSGALGAINDPQKFGERFVEQTAGSIIPNIVGKFATATDSQSREIQGGFQAIKADIPGARQTLYPRRDMFGRPIPNQQGFSGFYDPFRSTEAVTATPLNQELRRLQDEGYGVTPPSISKKETFPATGKVNITQEQQDLLEGAIGANTQKHFNQLMSSSDYQTMTDSEKERALSNLSKDVRQAVKAKFVETTRIGDPDKAVKSLTKKQLAIYRGLGEIQSVSAISRYEQSPDAPKDAGSKLKLYIQAGLTQPVDTFSAVATGQPVRKIRGDAVVVERELGLANDGDSPTELDHRMPLWAGGQNNEKNLGYLSPEDHALKTAFEASLRPKLESGEMSKGDVKEAMEQFEKESGITYFSREQVESVVSKIENSQPYMLSKSGNLPSDPTMESSAVYYAFDLDKLGERPEGAVAGAKWETKAYKTARDILTDDELNLSPEEKQQAIESVGLSYEDVEYFDLASETNRIKSIAVREQISGIQDREELFETLVSMRKEVAGKVVLAPGVIDDLVDEGFISKEEGKTLKNTEFGKEGAPKVKMTGRGSGAKLKKIKFVPLKFSTKSPSIPRIKLSEGYQIPQAPQVPSLRVSTPKVEQPKYQVKFNL